MKLIKMYSKLLTSVAVAAALTTSVAAQAEELKKLNFGIISTESSQNLKTIWVPFLKDMSEKLGVEVKPFFASDYAGVIQAMRFNKVDVAWYGNKSAMEAVDRAGGEIFAQTVDAAGNPGYWSLLIAHKDNNKINNVADMLKHSKDLTFGNGDPNSTSGFLVPSYYVFTQNNVEPKKIFKRVTNANHQSNFLSVANGQVDVASNNTESLARIKASNPDKYNKVKVIWKSPLIPSDPIVWRKNLADADKAKLRNFFMTYGANKNAEELKILNALGWAPFKASTDNQLLPIRQLVLFKKRIKIEGKTSLSASDKAAQLKTIDDQLVELNTQMAELETAKN
jgi:phosphonate transport system substrate-binding protein